MLYYNGEYLNNGVTLTGGGALLHGDAALGVCLRGGILLCKLLFQFLHLLQFFHCHVVVHLF